MSIRSKLERLQEAKATDTHKDGTCEHSFMGVMVLAFKLILLGLFLFTVDTYSQSKGSDQFEKMFQYIDHGKGFAYIPIKPFPKNPKTRFYEAEAVLEAFELWRSMNPNKLILQIVGDHLGKNGGNSGFFLIYRDTTTVRSDSTSKQER